MNLFVVVVHALNRHWLGPYGNEWVQTPTFCSFAADSVVFDQYLATETTTELPRSPRPSAPPSTHRTLIDDRRCHFDEPGWDEVVVVERDANSAPGDSLLKAVSKSLDRVREKPSWLMWVETDRFVPPWDLEVEAYQEYAEKTGGFTEDGGPDEPDAPEPIDDPGSAPIDASDVLRWHQVRNSFAAAITTFDADLGRLLKLVPPEAAVVVLGTQGWPLGEHGVVGPRDSRPHGELVDLPLMIRLPNASRIDRVDDLVIPADIPAMLESLLKNEPLNWPRDREAVITIGPTVRSVRTKKWALIAPGEAEPARMYVRPDDLWEANDLAARLPDEYDRLMRLLEGQPPPTE